jgi:hypothetical protein
LDNDAPVGLACAPFLVRFSELARSGHAPSWADFITITRELEFSVHRIVTARPLCVRRKSDQRPSRVAFRPDLEVI